MNPDPPQDNSLLRVQIQNSCFGLWCWCWKTWAIYFGLWSAIRQVDDWSQHTIWSTWNQPFRRRR